MQVGMHGGPAPWKATHSIYSMFLLDVKHTVAVGAYWPAKPYHDDIDFPRICEEKGFVAAKCQWLFLHKVSEGLLDMLVSGAYLWQMHAYSFLQSCPFVWHIMCKACCSPVCKPLTPRQCISSIRYVCSCPAVAPADNPLLRRP